MSWVSSYCVRVTCRACGRLRDYRSGEILTSSCCGSPQLQLLIRNHPASISDGSGADQEVSA